MSVEEQAPPELPRWRAGAARVVALAFSLYHLYIAGFGAIQAHRHRILHLTLAAGLTLLTQAGPRVVHRRLRALADLLLAAAMAASLGYLLANYDFLTGVRFQFVTAVTTAQLLLGVAFLIAVLELARRLTGWVLPAIVVVALTYPFVSGLPGMFRHGGYGLGDLVDVQYLTTLGAFGVPLGASADYIALFVIFGAFLEASGLGVFIMELASSVAGRFRGGPAKVAVISSALTGTISGSAPANVLTTGPLTIPLMKRIGYPAHVAGAVEAAASTGGVLMPPVMGSIAFIMSQYTGIPYARIVLYALVPALLYFLGLLLSVHWSALRHGVAGVDAGELPSLRQAVRARGHLFLPIVVLVVLIAQGYSPQYAVFYSILSVLVLANLRPGTRMGLRAIVGALEKGARSALMIALATAVAGMIVGVLELTGVSVRFAQGATSLVDNLFLALLMTAVVTIALGLGIPPSASYIVQVAVTIPALITFLTLGGMAPAVALVVAHFFVMYYAALAVLTPPDALAAVAAAGLAGSDFMHTAITGTRVAFVAFLVPFMTAYRPGLLLLGDPLPVAGAILAALLAVVILSIALEGHFVRPLAPPARVALLAAGAGLVLPSLLLNIAGTAVAALVCAQQLWRAQAPAGAPRVVR